MNQQEVKRMKGEKVWKRGITVYEGGKGARKMISENEGDKGTNIVQKRGEKEK